MSVGRTDRSPRRKLQDELRARGLPLVLEPAVRRRALLIRAAPVLLGAALVTLGLDAIDLVSDHPLWDDPSDQLIESIDEIGVLLITLMGIALTGIGPFAAWVSAIILRLLGPTGRRVLSALAVTALLATAFMTGTGIAGKLATRLLITAAVLLLIYLGVGTMITWAGRRAIRELSSLGPMISRVLPVLLLAVLFLFFNSNIWQIVAHLDEARTWGSVAVLAGLTLILTVVNSRDALSPLIMIDPESGRPSSAHPLRPGERLNLLVVTVLVTLIQITWFALLTLVFFILFGVLAIPEATAQLWMGRPPDPIDGVLAITPVSQQLCQVALLISAFSALNFAASAGVDQRYRATFVHPVLAEAREGLRVREDYLATPPDPQPAPDRAS